MSHESVISDLKKLIKQPVTAVEPEAHVDNLLDESDRANLILNAAMIEDFLLWRLKGKMPSLNKEEQDRIFSFEGPCGSFSNRIRMAQGLEIIDRKLRRVIEVIKELRNVAAHCHCKLQFDTPEVRAAIIHLFAPAGGEVDQFDRSRMRNLYSLLCASITSSLGPSGGTVDLSEVMSKERKASEAPLRALRGTQPEASPQNHPEDQTGK